MRPPSIHRSSRYRHYPYTLAYAMVFMVLALALLTKGLLA